VGEPISFAGLDVHKETIAVCVAGLAGMAKCASLMRLQMSRPHSTDGRLGSVGTAGNCALSMRPDLAAMQSTGTSGAAAINTW
jgi:hypothetical protein